MADLLEIEKWERYTSHPIPSSVSPTSADGGDDDDEIHSPEPRAGRDYFACSYCLKIRCASKFSNRQMMFGKREDIIMPLANPIKQGGVHCPGPSDYERLAQWMDASTHYTPGNSGSIPRGDPVRRAERYTGGAGCGTGRMMRLAAARRMPRGEKLSRTCLDCGIRYGYYMSGKVMAYGGAELADNSGGGYGIVCVSCGHFRRLDIGTKRNQVYRRRNCAECLERKKKETKKKGKKETE